MVEHLSKAEFLKKVANVDEYPNEWRYLGTKPAIVDFYASWCGPCKMVSPILDELSNEYKDKIVIYKIDTDKELELSEIFGIRSIPTLFFIPIIGQPQIIQGAVSKSQFKELIKNILLAE